MFNMLIFRLASARQGQNKGSCWPIENIVISIGLICATSRASLIRFFEIVNEKFASLINENEKCVAKWNCTASGI